MADEIPTEWPNERLRILVPTWTLMGISTIFVVWRVVYGLLRSRKFLVCDYLLVIACCLNIAATSVNQTVVDTGLGRHLMDPTVFPQLRQYSYYLWIDQILNLIAVSFLKWSICAWLLVLNFSRVYQAIIWLSILMVTALNFLAPILTLMGCVPLEKSWNYGYQGDGYCWARGNIYLSYTQGISNIITDIVYMAAPLIYLSRVQLSKRTQIGIRIVFLMSIPATICSVFKTVELRAITLTNDPTWDGMNLAIWSSAECSIGIWIASLPPLRKAFDTLFKKVLPSTLTNSHKTPQYGYGARSTTDIRMKSFHGSKAYHSKIPGESILDGDDESDRHILEGAENKDQGIMKSTKVTITQEAGEDEASGSSSKGGSSPGLYKPNIDWDSPHLESGTAPPHKQKGSL